MRKIWLAIKNQAAKEYRKSPVLSILVIIGSIVFGTAHGWLKNEPPTTPRNQHGQVEAEDIRLQLTKIDLHNASSIDDYISRAMHVRALVPQMIAFYDRGHVTIATMERKYQSQPNMLELAKFIEKLNERDEYGFKLLEEELRFAYEMQSLPANKRQQFFDKHIVPLKQAE